MTTTTRRAWLRATAPSISTISTCTRGYCKNIGI